METDINKFKLQNIKIYRYSSKSNAGELWGKLLQIGIYIYFFQFEGIIINSFDASPMDFSAFVLLKLTLEWLHEWTLKTSERLPRDTLENLHECTKKKCTMMQISI